MNEPSSLNFPMSGSPYSANDSSSLLSFRLTVLETDSCLHLSGRASLEEKVKDKGRT